MSVESEEIFNAIHAIRPESELPLIGLAVTKMNKNQAGEAARVLWDKALKINPESDLAKSFLGLALKLSGMNNESRTVLEEVLQSGQDPQATDIAKSLLAEIN